MKTHPQQIRARQILIKLNEELRGKGILAEYPEELDYAAIRFHDGDYLRMLYLEQGVTPELGRVGPKDRRGEPGARRCRAYDEYRRKEGMNSDFFINYSGYRIGRREETHVDRRHTTGSRADREGGA